MGFPQQDAPVAASLCLSLAHLYISTQAHRQDHCWDLLAKHHCSFLACSSEPCWFPLHRWSQANELSSSLPDCQRKRRAEITRVGPLCPRLCIPSTPRRSPLGTLQPAPPEASHHNQAGAVQCRGLPWRPPEVPFRAGKCCPTALSSPVLTVFGDPTASVGLTSLPGNYALYT